MLSDFEQQVHEADGQAGNRLRFISASQLCAAPTQTNWLVKSYLDINSMSVLFGESGSMKSFVAIDLGLCLSTGRIWQGNVVRQHGPVFYIAGEGSHGVGRRIRAWAIERQVNLDNVPFYVSDRPAQFLDKESALDVVAGVDELRSVHGDPVLVIIDTLNRNFGPGDENSTADMTRFNSAIDEHVRTRYGCAVMIVHHSGLSNTVRARGAGALRAALDWEYRLKKNSDGTRTLECTKSKDHEPPPDITFKPGIITLDGWVDPDDNEVMTSLVLRRTETAVQDYIKPLSGAKKIALDALISVGDEYVHIDKWRDAAYSSGIASSSSQEAKQKAFRRAVTDLLSAGYVKTRDDYYWLKPDIPGHSDK